MPRYFVNYMAYLSYLMQLPENISLNEEAINQKYKLEDKLYSLSLITLMDNPFKNTCENVFQVHSFTKDKENISNSVLQQKKLITVEVISEELATITIPYNYIYTLTPIIKGSLYRQKAYDMYIMNRLNNLELESIDDDEIIFYYNKFAQGLLYAKEELSDGSISLVKIYPQAGLDKIPNLCYICDSNYPEGMKDIITYLKGASPEHFIKEDLQQRNHKNFLERIYRKKD